MYIGEVPCSVVAYLPDAYIVPVHKNFTGTMSNSRYLANKKQVYNEPFDPKLVLML